MMAMQYLKPLVRLAVHSDLAGLREALLLGFNRSNFTAQSSDLVVETDHFLIP